MPKPGRGDLLEPLDLSEPQIQLAFLNSLSPRVFVVTGTLPGEAGVGEIILRDLVAATPEIELGFFGVLPRNLSLERFRGGATKLVGSAMRRYETAYRPVGGRIGELIAAAGMQTLFRRQVGRGVKEAVRIGRQFRPDFVWAILDCPTTIFAAVSIASQLNVPLRVLVWDAPELLAQQLNYDRFSTNALLRQFATVLRSAERIAVVGETMQQAYRDRYGAKSLIVRHGLAAEEWRTPSAEFQNPTDLVIGYAGSNTAPDAFDTLVQCLDSHGWRIAGRNVVLRLVGVRYLLNARGPQQVEYFGWRRVSETVNLMAATDVLYLPQPFSERLRPLAELSFPTKLSTYLAAGRPILLHAPTYAAVVPFFDRYPFGEWCSSLNGDDLGSQLTRLATDHAVRETACAAISAARQEELNADRFIRSFREFLDPVAVRRPDVASTSLV